MFVRYVHVIYTSMVCPQTDKEIMSCIMEHNEETMYIARVILT